MSYLGDEIVENGFAFVGGGALEAVVIFKPVHQGYNELEVFRSLLQAHALPGCVEATEVANARLNLLQLFRL